VPLLLSARRRTRLSGRIRGGAEARKPAGPREPLVIVSPYAKPGYTDSIATSFAGILGYVEHTFGLAPLGVNDAGAYAYAHIFDYTQKPLSPIPMVNRPVPRGDHIDWAQDAEDS
jgi:hypothetical protein